MLELTGEQLGANQAIKGAVRAVDKVHIIICIFIYGLMVEIKYLFWGYNNNVLNQLKKRQGGGK